MSGTGRPETRPAASPETGVAERIRLILRALYSELHPKRAVGDITPGTTLDRDLGIDSLGRVELLMRLEREFGVDLAERAIMDAETMTDLVSAVAAAEPRAGFAVPRPEIVAAVEPVLAEPRGAATILDAMDYHLARHEDRPHVRVLASTGPDESLTYGELWAGAQRVAAGLRGHLDEQGRTVAIMLPSGIDFFFAFLGTLLAGGVPVPIYPPARRTQIEAHLLRQAGILRNAGARVLITNAQARPAARLIKAQVETLRDVATVAELSLAGEPSLRPVLRDETMALLQYTSGSTGAPKGVILTHGNLLSNIRAIGDAFRIRSDDVVVSWLPLYHDMGLIGCWLGSLYYGVPFVVMSPLAFLGRPERWLHAIHRFHGTLSAAPNFAYELCTRRIEDRAIDGLDLSSWRMAGNGAEAIQAGTIDRFVERFEAYGFRRAAMTPMYGLAENAVALTMSPVGRGPRVERIDRRALVTGGRALPSAAEAESDMVLVSSGLPVAGHEIRIVDEAGRETADRGQGRIEFRGPSATRGYFRNPDKTAELFDGDWLDTGDVGYVDGGELFVTGRIKDIIVRAGRNLYPEEIENAVGDLEGVRKGRVAVFASLDARTGTERLVVVAETRVQDRQIRHRLERAIQDTVTGIAETPPEDIVLAQPGAVLKTANGKIRRAACRELYEVGRLDRPPPVLWRQVAGLMQASILPLLRRWRRALGDWLYAVFFQLVYRALGPIVWPALMVTPGLERRRRVFRRACRRFARIVGIAPLVNGAEHIPKDQVYVLAANHQSFLDGLVLAAILPGDCAFTAKRELASQPIAGPFLRRLGVAFVERLDPAEGVADTRRLADFLKAGHPLVVFAEGTFDRRPGLRAFHMGAFILAAEAGVPVVPVAIRGTRTILRGTSWFARRGQVTITFSPPVEPHGADWRAAVELRDRVRNLILRHSGEPDLAYEPIAPPGSDN